MSGRVGYNAPQAKALLFIQQQGVTAMKKTTVLGLIALLFTVAILTMGMARRGEYDYEAREEERIAKLNKKEESRSQSATRGFASGVKEVASGPVHMLSDTAQGTAGDKSVDGAIGAVNTGSERLIDNTLKGSVKVATLGFGELHNYEIEEPEAGSGEPAKIKIKIPGT